MSSSAQHRAAERLRARILGLQLRPGEPLDESALAAEFGFSRTPLREILQRLAGEGYVVMEKHRGARVAPLDAKTFHTFFRAAPLIYTAIARLAANQSVRDEALTELEAIQARFRSAVQADDPSAMVEANHQFHFRMGQLADNPYLMPSLERLLIDHARLAHLFYRPSDEAGRQRVLLAADQHDAMLDALRCGDEDTLAVLTREHWAISRDRIDAWINAEPLALEEEWLNDAG